ncbi:Lysine histidine transporter-like 8 [Euphorbia peplus]|nr:Lysine histidine transporter-like 8 [Euphorbia peplus]
MGSEAIVEYSTSPTISAPPFQHSIAKSPLTSSPKTPKSPLISRLMSSPMASPVKKAIANMQCYMEQVGNFTKFDPQEAWLPITQSRTGNAYYAAFHTLSSGLGVQALVLPLAFVSLGWVWGLLCLSIMFMWQLYTLWLLIQLHESDSGMRYSRYLRLSMTAFGERLGKISSLIPTMYLSGGTCVTLIMIGGGTMKILFQIICQENCKMKGLSTIEWYIIFTCSAIILAQLPNLNSIAGVSLVGAVTAVSYSSLIWVVSILQARPIDISYDPPLEYTKSDVASLFSILNALGIIAFAFRGHNLVLEIQGTMPSSEKQPSRIPMWKGVKFAYFIIAICLFPLAIGGYWAYGNLIPGNGGMLNALYKYHEHDTSKILVGITSFLVIINCLTSFQIYAMPVFDNLELRYTSKMNKPCSQWLRSGIRVFFGCFAFFMSVALPFLPSLAGLIGGIALPVTFAYPCFMWILMKKPHKYGAIWCLNWVLGVLGMVLSVLVVIAAVWTIVTMGIETNFFRPK